MALLGSCASALKKQCESTNWFEHGRAVALSGRRLNSDNLVGQCQKEDVEVNEAQVDLGFKSGMGQYCTAEGAKETGRKGDPFNPDLCNPSIVSALQKDHEKGVVLYCKPSNGYQQGALGSVYKNVCPKALEDSFMTQFRKGKKVYIMNMIEAKTSELRNIENQMEVSQRTESRLKKQLLVLMTAQRLSQSRNPSPEQIQRDRDERDDVERQISQESYSRNSLQGQASTARSELAKLRIEYGSVDSDL